MSLAPVLFGTFNFIAGGYTGANLAKSMVAEEAAVLGANESLTYTHRMNTVFSTIALLSISPAVGQIPLLYRVCFLSTWAFAIESRARIGLIFFNMFSGTELGTSIKEIYYTKWPLNTKLCTEIRNNYFNRELIPWQNNLSRVVRIPAKIAPLALIINGIITLRMFGLSAATAGPVGVVTTMALAVLLHKGQLPEILRQPFASLLHKLERCYFIFDPFLPTRIWGIASLAFEAHHIFYAGLATLSF